MIHMVGFYAVKAHLTTRIAHHKKRAAEFEEKAGKVMEAFEKFATNGGTPNNARPDYMELIGHDVTVASHRQRVHRQFSSENQVESERRRAESAVSMCRQAQAEHLQRVEEFSFIDSHLVGVPASHFVELTYDELVRMEFIKPRGLHNQRTQFIDANDLELCDILDLTPIKDVGKA